MSCLDYTKTGIIEVQKFHNFFTVQKQLGFGFPPLNLTQGTPGFGLISYDNIPTSIYTNPRVCNMHSQLAKVLVKAEHYISIVNLCYGNVDFAHVKLM